MKFATIVVAWSCYWPHNWSRHWSRKATHWSNSSYFTGRL